MSSYNKVTLMGNLTRDPEVRYTPKGSAVCDIGIAVNRKWKDDNNQVKEEVTFVDVTFWGKTAENVGKYFSKGSPIFIEGRLATDSWEDKQTGQKKSKTKVVGELFQFIGGKSDGDSERRTNNDSSPRSERKTLDQEAREMPDDDCPF
jgi:single-strand DNA-binding protein